MALQLPKCVPLNLQAQKYKIGKKETPLSLISYLSILLYTREFFVPQTNRNAQMLPSKSIASASIQPSLSKQASHQHQLQLCQPADSSCSFQRRSMAEIDHSTERY